MVDGYFYVTSDDNESIVDDMCAFFESLPADLKIPRFKILNRRFSKDSLRYHGEDQWCLGINFDLPGVSNEVCKQLVNRICDAASRFDRSFVFGFYDYTLQSGEVVLHIDPGESPSDEDWKTIITCHSKVKKDCG